MRTRDQHAAMITGGKLYVGNDGGVYARELTKHATGDWKNLNVPMNDIVLHNSKLVVAADFGVYTSSDNGSTWSRLGTNLPNVVVSQLTVDPNGTIVAATHGRGIWTIAP